MLIRPIESLLNMLTLQPVTLKDSLAVILSELGNANSQDSFIAGLLSSECKRLRKAIKANRIVISTFNRDSNVLAGLAKQEGKEDSQLGPWSRSLTARAWLECLGEALLEARRARLQERP